MENLTFTSAINFLGMQHEKLVRDVYTKTMVGNHIDFVVMDIGLVLNPKWPYTGATPDGVVGCRYCGRFAQL